jgi:hypothetical protein
MKAVMSSASIGAKPVVTAAAAAACTAAATAAAVPGL